MCRVTLHLEKSAALSKRNSQVHIRLSQLAGQEACKQCHQHAKTSAATSRMRCWVHKKSRQPVQKGGCGCETGHHGFKLELGTRGVPTACPQGIK